jgi:pseudaminic acid synthase
MKIGKKNIGFDYKPFIIAEMSGNHNQSLDRALDIVTKAAETGVDAIKLQTYTSDTMTLDINEGDFFINDKTSLWYGKSLYDLYKVAHTPWDWHQPIMEKAKSLGLICFSTPFDETAVDFLENLNVEAYKIASFENKYISLIEKVAQTGKPVIVSLGMTSLSDIDDIVNTLRSSGCENFILLKCTSSYPSSPENSNLLTIPHLRKLFNCEVGLSDHTRGIGVSVASVAVGASVIEKHFTLRRSDGGVDSQFSMEPEEMKQLVTESEKAWLALGNISYGLTESEKQSIVFRRSIYIAEDVKKGDTLNKKNLRIVRPGYGLEPKYYKNLLNSRVNQDIRKGTPFNWKFVINKKDNPS